MAAANGGGETGVTGSFRTDDPTVSRDDHHFGWNQALKSALEKIPDSWRGENLTVTFEVYIKPNPGSVGEYKVHLRPSG